ncbi:MULTISPECIES: hypothetical protein [unclassified Epibacterium]|uniref:hypothetical protein n=1 Tax=unclassified Epibacterium TaxID=2639179 RepID=UPI001EF61776|nr:MULTISPECIES: hypothetical protein [unclassified Epibacterium]MCG7624557.1 hypothetical protein [Epibacterium sp. Ofav1-8]MCG7627799.1 hypothetical protein [Epibacterium sp. MM17-32]
MKQTAAALATAFLVAGGQVAQAQQQLVYTVVVPSGQFGSANFLKELVRSLATIQAFCGGLEDRSYRVDCMAERLQAVSGEIPEGTDYDEVRSVLAEASAKLETLARDNRDRSKGRINVSSAKAGGGATARPLVAVDAAELAAVNQQAEAILDEARTVLLRSAGSRQRQSQYTRIAQALDSSKVLLRS